MIITESERSKAPKVGERVFFHRDTVRANESVQRSFCWPLNVPMSYGVRDRVQCLFLVEVAMSPDNNPPFAAAGIASTREPRHQPDFPLKSSKRSREIIRAVPGCQRHA